MKKFFVTAACLCMLAIPAYGTNVDAASVPWDSTIELNGVVGIGSTMTVPARVWHYDEETGESYYTGGVAYYQLNVTAGQSYYIDSKDIEEIDFYDSTGYSSSDENYYAVKNETIYIRLDNYSEEEAAQATVKAGQTFTGNVTKSDGMGDNIYYYTPSLSGQYTFKITSPDEDADPGLSIGMMKRDYFTGLKAKDCKWVYGFGYEEVTANLQAGIRYAISADVGTYTPYTLTLTQKPSVPVSGVTAKKKQFPKKLRKR